MTRLLARLLLPVLLLTALVGVPATAPAAPPRPDLVERIRDLPGVVSVDERKAPRGYRFFVIRFRQPDDHRHPGRGHFTQRLTLLHRDLARPMVLYTSGYGLDTRPAQSEPARIVDGNELALEYRFFRPSRPAHPDWQRQLTIRQAAADQHRVIRSFQRLYDARWITTGGSKGGMTATYHRRFYPGDVDATVAYVAPNDVDNAEDSAYDAFQAGVGTASCRAALVAVQRRILGSDRTWFRDRLADEARELGLTARTLGGFDRVVEISAVDLYFTFWQYTRQSACRSVPGPDASRQAVWDWTERVLPLTTYLDELVTPYLPYYYQASAQLGWPAPYEREVADLLAYPGASAAPSYLPTRLLPRRFDAGAMADVDRWVRTRAQRVLFVYGENDPWSAEPFSCGTRRVAQRQCSVHEVADGTHGSRIGDLPRAERRRLVAQLRRWAGLPAGSRSAPRVDGLAARVVASAPPGRLG